VQRLLRKFTDKSQKEPAAPVSSAIFTETDKELILSVRVNKAALSREMIQQIKSKIDAVCARLDSLSESDNRKEGAEE
jgi:hypothetical protein